MTKVAQLVKGLVALAVLAGLVVGVPCALWHFVGWPLPHHVPSAAQVGRALNHQGIPAQTLVDALAVVVWLTWATLVASLLVEIPAALSGRHAPKLPIAGVFQPVTGRLVAAVIIACLTLAPRPAHPGAPAASGNPGLTARRPVAALVVRDATLTASVTPISAMPTTSAPDISATATSAAPMTPPASSAAPTTYVVQRGDTLWGIAQRELGDPLRWSEIYQLNEDRPQPGGLTLTDPHWIDPGWTLLLPTSVPGCYAHGRSSRAVTDTTDPHLASDCPHYHESDHGHSHDDRSRLDLDCTRLNQTVDDERVGTPALATQRPGPASFGVGGSRLLRSRGARHGRPRPAAPPPRLPLPASRTRPRPDPCSAATAPAPPRRSRAIRRGRQARRN